MAVVARFWRGDAAEKESLIDAITHNHQRYFAEGPHVDGPCGACELVESQHTLDGLLFMRRTYRAGRLWTGDTAAAALAELC